MKARLPPGATVGVVTRLDDPEQQGRIMVELEWLAEGVQSNWCRVAARQGGYSRGTFIRPELGDEVLVLFEGGDLHQPWVVGTLWNGKDAPPGPGNPDGRNDHKFFQTRSGAQMVFDDGADGGAIAFHDAKGKLHTTFDVPGQHIHSLADTGEIAISAPAGTVRIECQDLEVHSTETTTVNVSDAHDIQITGARTLEVEENDLEQLARSSLMLTTPSLSLTSTEAAEIATGATSLSVAQVQATIEPSFLIEHRGPVTRNHGAATYEIADFCTEVAGVGRSGPFTLTASVLGITADETFVARIGGPVGMKGGQATLKGASVAFGKDGGDGQSMSKAGVVSIQGGLVNLNPQMFTGPATKALDIMIGFDAHNSAPGIPPVAVPPFPLMPHGFVLPIYLDVKSTVLINNMPMAGSGSTAFGLHMPPFLPLPWTPVPVPVRQILASAVTALFVPMVMSAGMMAISMAQAAIAGQSAVGVLTGMDAQQWRGRFLPMTQSPGAFLAFLSGLAPHPMASGSITIGSPNVLGEDMPFGMMLPFPFSNSCSDIPVVPNATVIAMSNVMVGVSLKQVLAQLAMALVAYGITQGVSRTKLIKKIADPVDIVSGARIDTDVDLELPGPLPLKVVREHLSTAIGRGQGGILGAGNRLCFEERLESPPLGERDERVWIWHTGDLREVELPWVEAIGERHFDRPERVEIARTGEQTWDLIDADGITHHFERWHTRRARLAARSDRHGNTIRFVYDPDRPAHMLGILDSAGRSLRLEYTSTAAGERLAAIWFEGHPARPASRRLRRYAFDVIGRLVATAGPDDIETTYHYDADGRVAARREPSGYTWHWHHDGLDRVTCTYGADLRYYHTLDYQPGADMTITRDHAGHRTLWHYDADRNVDRVIDPEGGIREEKWEDNTPVAASIGEELVVERTYDARGRLLTETLVGGGKRQREYDARGLLVAEIGPTGDVTRYRRDDRGDPRVTLHPDGSRTLRRFDAAGRVVAEVGPDAIEHAYVFDDFGDLIEERHDGAPTRHRYDAFGRVVATTGPDGTTRRFEYDVCGRLTRVIYPDGTEERRAYDAAGQCVEHRVRDGGTWRFEYDGAGRKLRTHTPEGRTLTSAFDLDDRYASHTTDGGRGFRYRYDRCDRLVEHATDDGVIDRYDHDSAGRLVRRRFADGSRIEWDPAPHGEPQRVTTGDGVRQTFAYDPAERVAEAVEYGPDALLREGPRQLDAVRVAFTRRSDGVVLAEHGPHAAIKYAYAPGGFLTRYRVDETDSRIARDEKGRPVRIEAPDGTWRIARGDGGETWTAPDGATHWIGGAGWSVRDAAGRTVAAYSADIDALGRCVAEDLRRRAERGVRGYSHAHRYDLDGRLVGAVDAEGNRRLPGAAYGAGNRLLRDAHGPVGYDPRGRITRRHDSDGIHRYRWDDLDRLTEVETPDGTIYSYRYDALSRLVERVRDPVEGSVTRSTFIWAGDVLAGEDRACGTRVRYLRLAARDWTPWAAWVIEPSGQSTLHRLHADIRGAVVAAAVGDRLSFWAEYDPYGAVTATAGDFDPRLRLRGMWADPDTGLCFNRFRWYAPDWGRYLTPDPLGVEGNRNVYAYTDGDPIHFSDPLGLGHEAKPPGTKKGDNDVADGDATPPPKQQGTEPSDGIPPKVVRQDDRPSSSEGNAPGSRKSHVDEEGNLVPANPEGNATIQQHIRGSEPSKSDSPYTSTKPPGNDEKVFGGQEIEIDTSRLQQDIEAGKVEGVEIVSNEQITSELQAGVDVAQQRYDANPSKKNKLRLENARRDLANATRDNEVLIKGVVPAEYVSVKPPKPTGE